MKSVKQEKALKNTFSPEFRNRLDSIVQFSALSEDLIIKIVDKFLVELETKLLAKNIEIIVDLEAKKWLARKGFDPKMGARPMARLIDQQIKRRLSSEILFGKLEKGGEVKISVEKDRDELELHFLEEETV